MTIQGISLVVATLGTRDLRPFLASLKEQTNKAYECIIIDQSPSRDLEALKSAYPDIIYIHSDNKGNSLNRNLGIKAAKFPIIGFPDDDCAYTPDVINNVLKQFESHPKAAGISGVWVDSITGEPVMSGRGAGLATPWNIWSSLTNLTIFLRTEIVKEVGGYTAHFGLGSGFFEGGEETDLALKVLNTGAKIFYTDSVKVLHRQDKYVLTNRQKQAGYEEAWGALFQKWTTSGRMRGTILAKFFFLLSRTLLISLYYLLKGNLTYSSAYWALNRHRIAGWQKNQCLNKN